MLGVNYKLQEIAYLAIEITTVDFGVPSDGGFRTESQQKRLFDANLSQLNGVDKRSKHQDGDALDFFAYVDHKASWKPEHLALVACAMLQAASQLGYKIEWGGLWKSFQDMPHIQLSEVEL